MRKFFKNLKKIMKKFRGDFEEILIAFIRG